MVDTERFHLGPHTVQAVGAIATAISRGRPTNLLDLATYVPLDVESIGRIVDSLADEEIVSLSEGDGHLKTIELLDVAAYADQAKLVEEGEHLSTGFVQNLVALLADADWCRKVRDQHLVLQAAASTSGVVDAERIVALVDIPPARVRAVIGDFETEGCVLTESDEDSMTVTFPASLQYPPERFQRNEELLSHVETRAAPIHRIWWVVLGVAAAVLLLFIASRLAMT